MNDREEEKYCGDKNACSSPSYDLHAGLDKFIREREDFLFFFFFFFYSLTKQESRRIINTDPGTIVNWKGDAKSLLRNVTS